MFPLNKVNISAPLAFDLSLKTLPPHVKTYEAGYTFS
jgi:hypothetical protein